MIIDFEHHHIPRARPPGDGPSRKDAVRTGDASIHSQLFDLEAQIRDMDRVGIDVAVQSCPRLGYHAGELPADQRLHGADAKRFSRTIRRLAHAPVLEEAGLHELKHRPSILISD